MFHAADGDVGQVNITTMEFYEAQGFEAPKEIPVANSEELVTNGDFATDTGWTKGVGWSIGGGVAVAASITGDLQQSNAIGFVTGKMYQVTYDVVSVTSGSIFFKQSAYSGVKRGAVGTYTETYTALGTSIFVLRSDNSFSGTIDNVSIKEVTSYSGGGFEKEAYKLVEDTSSGTHYLRKASIPATSGNVYTLSIYAKKGERSWMAIRSHTPTDDTWFDLDNGTIGTTSSDHTATITPLANGWYRCSITYTEDNTDARAYLYLADADNSNSYTGDGTSGIYIAYAQLEESNYASSLMLPVTEGSTTSRVADTVTNGGSQSLFGGVNASGVLYAEIAANSDGLYNRFISISDGSGGYDNSLRLGFSVTTNQIYGRYYLGGVIQATLAYSVTDETEFSKVGFRYAENDFSLWINGTKVATDTSGSTLAADTLTTVDFDRSGGYNPFYGKTNAIAVVDYLSDDQMVKLTEEGYDTFNALATANNFIIR